MNSPLKVSLENIIPLTEARDHFSQIVTEVQQDKLYVLTKGGKPVVAIIDIKYLESVTGGSVRPEHIETEIQKDPSKVGRTTMIKHETPVVFSEPSSLVFPKTNISPTPIVPPPAPTSQPIKINFQPATTPTPPAPLPTPPVTPPSMPTMPPPSPFPTPTTPTPPIAPAPSPVSTPPAIPTSPISTQTNIPTNNSGNVIDMIPTPEEQITSTASRVSQDDKPGPAQYAGEDTGEPEDMEI